jgi:predicted small metal-binding protein
MRKLSNGGYGGANAYELNRKNDTIQGQEKTDMAKIMKCRSVGLDCDFVAHGETEAQVMEKVAEHAKKDHGMQHIPEDVATKVRAAIRNE